MIEDHGLPLIAPLVPATAEEVAASRPPDHVGYSIEEPVRASEPTRRIVATDVRRTLFTAYVAEYTEVEEHVVLYWKRDKIETWYVPEGMAPVMMQPLPDGTAVIEYAYVPAQTVARRTPQVSTEPGVWRDVP